MNESDTLMRIFDKKNQKHDALTEFLNNYSKIIMENPFIKQILEIEKGKKLTLDQIDEDLNYSTLHILDRMDQLEKTIKNRFQKIESQVNNINEKTYPIKTIVIDEISRPMAKKKIWNFIDKYEGKELYPSEIAEKLGIPFDLTIKIIQELIKEKKIEVNK